MKKRLFSLALALVMCLSLLPAAAFAATHEEKLQYSRIIEYDEDGDCIGVAGVHAPIKGVLKVPEEVDGLPVKVIAWDALSGQTGMTGIELPESIVEIDRGAFQGCTGLTEIALPSRIWKLGDSAFEGCTALKTVSLQPGIRECGEDCWKGTPWYDSFPAGIGCQDGYLICAKGDDLGAVTVPEGIHTILPGVMKDNLSLTSLSLPSSLQRIGRDAFSGCANLTEVQGMEYAAVMDYRAFYKSGLQGEIRLSPDMKSVPDDAFGFCKEVTGVQLPAGLKSVGNGAFAWCEKLTGAVLPQGLEYVGYQAFYANDLKAITIPASVGKVAEMAFANNRDLLEIHAQGLPEELGRNAFKYTGWMDAQENGPVYLGNWLVDFNGWMDRDYDLVIRPGTKIMPQRYADGNDDLGSVTIPNSLTEVPKEAFENCSSLHSVTIEPGVKKLAGNAFCGCSALTTFTMPDTITEMEGSVFRKCQGLKEIYFSENVTTIPIGTFSYCSSLEKVVLSDKLEILEPYSFEHCTGLPTMHFGPKLSRIGWRSFEGCTGLKTLHFAGPAPTMESSCFSDVQAEIHYNATDPTWDTELVPNWAEGQLTWAPETPKGALPATKLTVDMGENGVDLQWNPVSGADHYEIWSTYNRELPYTKIGESRTTSYTHTKAHPGSAYRYRVRAMAANGQPGVSSDIQLIEVSMAAPKVTGTIDPATGIPTVQWNDVPGADRYHVIIHSATMGTYVEDTVIRGTKYVHKTALPGSSYTYYIYAVNEDGGEGPSGMLYLDTPLPKTEVRVALNSNGQPVVSWDDVDFAEGYEVRIQRDGGEPQILQVQDTTLTHWATRKGTYSYQVRAVKENGQENGPWSDPQSIRVTRTEGPAPQVEVSCRPSTGKPVLQWTEVPGAVGYEVERRVGSGAFALLYTARGTSLTNGSAKAGTGYGYRVRALAEDGATGAWSEIVTAVCTLAQPDVTVTSRSDGKPVLTWDKIDGAVKYEIYFSANGGDFQRLTAVSGTKLNHTSAKADTTYAYQVRALADNSAADGVWSEAVTFTVKEQSLTAPTLTATNKRTTGKPYLKWDKVDGAEKYEVYRAASKDGKYSRLWSGSGTALTNGSAKTGTTYYYKVRAVAADGTQGPFSAIKTRTCDLPCPDVKATTRSDGKPVLTWKKIDGAVKYEVYRSTDGGDFSRLTTVKGTKLTNTSAKRGHTYTYKVKAIASRSAANSNYSYTDTVKVK